MKKIMWRVSALCVSFLLLTFAIAPSIAAAASGLNIKTPDGVGVNKRYVFEADPGDTFETSVNFVNQDPEEALVWPGLVDSYVNDEGQSLLKAPADEQIAFGMWAKYESDRLDENGFILLEPYEMINVPIVVEVPVALAPGAYSGAITIQKAPEKTDTGNVTVGAVAGTRLATMFYINVSGESVFDVKWDGVEATGSDAEAATRTYELTFSNDGNTAVDITVDTKVEGMFHDEPLFEQSGNMQLLPQLEKQMKITWPEVPSYGLFTVTFEARYDESKMFVTEGKEYKSEELGTKTVSVPLIPWVIIIVFAVLVVAFLFFFILGKRKKKRFIDTCGPYKVKKGDNLVEMSMKAGVNWKMVAKVNKIKAPYFLMPGTTILFPKKKK